MAQTSRRTSKLLWIFSCIALSTLLGACFGGGDDEPSGPVCPSLTGSSWVPAITGAGASNHNAQVSVSQTVLTEAGTVTGFAQAAGASREITVTIPMTEDLGAYGSLSLSANVTGVASAYEVYPLLVYLSDGTNEWINLARSGAAGDCASSGYFTIIPSGSPNVPDEVVRNSSCSITWPSAYYDRGHWDSHWLASAPPALPIVNTFPTCNSASPAAPGTVLDPACAFNTTFFQGGKLRYGGNYTAKYVLLSGSYSSLSGVSANVEVTVIKKTAATAGTAVDVNVILVGTDNIQASRTTKGQMNLNTFFTDIHTRYSAAGVNLGTVRVFEWACESGGDSFASVNQADLPRLYRDGGGLLPASSEGAVNLFLVKEFADLPGVLGIAGAIGGPVSNGTSASGVAVATLGKLALYNESCPETGPCPITSQKAEFAQLGPTVAHEMGHYLGLFHPSEENHTFHDLVYDTPICTQPGAVTIENCKSDTNALMGGQSCATACPTYSSTLENFCPTVPECQFNHLMFRTNKHFVEGTGDGDGNMISSQAAAIINYHPLIK